MFKFRNKKLILIVSGLDARPAKYFSISTHTLWFFLFLSILIVISYVLMAVWTIKSATKVSRFDAIQKELLHKKDAYEGLSYSVEALQKKVRTLIDKEEEIRRALGEKQWYGRNHYRKFYTRKNAKSFDNVYQEILTDHQYRSKKVVSEFVLDYLHKTVDDIEVVLPSLTDYVYIYDKRFAYIPSIYPLYGDVASNYGVRMHPISKTYKQHNGVDIASWTGAPIRVTANGIVDYAGWYGGFGFTVIVEHSFGYSTIYAHCSKLLVSKGDVVHKGEVIAQVGNTGMSTGPHLHYEVRKWGEPISPRSYLNLGMYTAATKMW